MSTAFGCSGDDDGESPARTASPTTEAPPAGAQPGAALPRCADEAHAAVVDVGAMTLGTDELATWLNDPAYDLQPRPGAVEMLVAWRPTRAACLPAVRRRHRVAPAALASAPVPSSSVTSDSAPSGDELERALQAHRTELTGFCYRMLGSGSEAEDAVQETMVRAWRSIDRFEGRSSLRSWLYRIANNVCIDMHRSPQRRARPMEMGPSSTYAEAKLGEPLGEHAFVQPVQDERVIDLDGDPADVAAARETIRLAFVAALQRLPARQRSALILCEVLRWQATEVAELLDTSVASVNSALQRARATLAEAEDEPLDAPAGPEQQQLLADYVDAFERYDIPKLVTLLHDDVVLSMPPWDLWLVGADDLAGWFLGEGIVCKDGRLIPVHVNGTAGFANYHKVAEGVWEPWAIQVIEVAGGQIVGHHNFVYPELFAQYGLPERIEA